MIFHMLIKKGSKIKSVEYYFANYGQTYIFWIQFKQFIMFFLAIKRSVEGHFIH